MRNWFVYILTNKPKGTLYVGVTSNLQKRVWEHKNGLSEDSFVKKYNLDKLVYYETHNTFENALPREKKIKKWRRQWKLELIEKFNPEWNDLSEEIFNY